MIGFITGEVIHIQGSQITLLTASGIGYRVTAAGDMLSLVQVHQTTSCYIHTAVRETDISLYGFSSANDRALFEQVLTVSGIGPKVALAIASVPREAFRNALAQGDIAQLKKIPGLGPKTAKKLVLELQDTLVIDSDGTDSSTAIDGKQEAVEALVGLGYEPSDVRKALEGSPETLDTEGLIRYFLTHQV